MYLLIPVCTQFHYAYGIPICELFSDPCMFAYGDPHMHMSIPVWEIMHMGIQELISHMEISPYAYG